MQYDVLVVGGGPAGAAAAWHLASVGVRVLVLEARPVPRRKVCAGAVSQKAVRLLQSWGIDITPVVEGSMVEIAFFYRYRHPAVLRHRQPYALNVCRDKCDQYLLQQAEQAGAAVRTGCPVRSVRLEADRASVTCAQGDSYQAQVVVGADGANSAVRRAMGLGRLGQMGMGAEALLPYESLSGHAWDRLTGLQTTALIDYGIIPFGYGWIFPKRDHLNVGLGTFRHCRLPLKELLTRHCQARFPGLNLDLPLRGHPIPLYRPPIQGKRALLVGDAGGIVDPLVGEGIYYALRSGELAAQAVSAGLTTGRLEGFRDYERAVASEIIAEFRAASLLATLLYNATAVMHYHLVRKLRIVEQMLTVICGDLTYRQFCSWVLRNMPRELLRSAPAMTEQAFWSAGRIN